MMTEICAIIAVLFVLGGIVMYLGNRRVDKVTRRSRWLKYGVYVLIVYTMLGSALAGYFVWIAGIIVILGLFELIRVASYRERGMLRKPILKWSLLVYLGLSYCVISFAHVCSPPTLVFVYVVVAAFDGFSQVIGQLLGKHKLAHRISPGKTIEGAAGGLIAAVSIATLLHRLPPVSPVQAAMMGTGLSLTGLCGDLLASWYKRLHSVKDFGNILPGHGGVLDRFDSLLTAITAFWIYTLIVR